jgi:hypothetical protein
MPFGLGLLEVLIILLPLLVLGAGVGIALLAARRFLGGSARRSGPADAQDERLAAELRETRSRLGAVEAQVAQLEESLAFTQALLEKRSDASPALGRPPESPVKGPPNA